MAALFENLNGLQNIDFLVGDSPEDLRAQIRQIRTPVKELGFVVQGSKHIVWLLPLNPLRKRTRAAQTQPEKETKGI